MKPHLEDGSLAGLVGLMCAWAVRRIAWGRGVRAAKLTVATVAAWLRWALVQLGGRSAMALEPAEPIES